MSQVTRFLATARKEFRQFLRDRLLVGLIVFIYTGDLVLCAAAEALEPDADTRVIRLGGEEFLLLLRGDDVVNRAERRRQAIATRVAARVPGLDRMVTASMGLVQLPEGDAMRAEFHVIYGHCDRLLYEAKHTGRNRTMREKLQSFGAPRVRAA